MLSEDSKQGVFSMVPQRLFGDNWRRVYLYYITLRTFIFIHFTCSSSVTESSTDVAMHDGLFQFIHFQSFHAQDQIFFWLHPVKPSQTQSREWLLIHIASVFFFFFDTAWYYYLLDCYPWYDKLIVVKQN